MVISAARDVNDLPCGAHVALPDMCEMSISVKGLVDWIEWAKHLVICQRPVLLGKQRTEFTVRDEAAQRGRYLQKAAACNFFFNIHSGSLLSICSVIHN